MSTMLLILGFSFNIIMYFHDTRNNILAYSAASTLLFGLYNFVAVGITAGVICCALVGNTLYQWIHKEADLDKTQGRRLIVATISALAGTLIFSNTSSDFLPLLAFLLVCYAETSACTKTIYVLYLISVGMWIAYALANQDLIYAGTNMLLFLLNAFICLRQFGFKRSCPYSEV